MTINKLLAILEDYRVTYPNYKVKVDLDHCKSPDKFDFDINDEEKTITIIQGNCGL